MDRLNSLLEHNGELIINESGSLADGSLRKISPHRDFRVFFTLDPVFGPVSRAMRNRCVEIHFDDLDPANGPKLFSADLKALVRPLIPNADLIDRMIDFFVRIGRSSAKKFRDWAESISVSCAAENVIAFGRILLSAQAVLRLNCNFEESVCRDNFGNFERFVKEKKVFKDNSCLGETKFFVILGDLCRILSKNMNNSKNLNNSENSDLKSIREQQKRVLSMISIENMNFADFTTAKRAFEKNCDISLSEEEQSLKTFVTSEYLENFKKLMCDDFKSCLDVEYFSELVLIHF